MWHVGRCAACAAVLLSVFLFACSSPEEEFAAHMGSAAELARDGETENAILEYHNALRIDPSSVAANENLGDLLLRQADLSATYYIGEAVRLDPSRIDLAMRLVRVMLVMNQIDDAEAVMKVALESHPDNALVHSTHAELLLHRNDPDGAREAALEATKLAPEDPQVWFRLGRVLQGKMRMAGLTKTRPPRGIRREAIAAFEHADKLAEGMVMARVERARTIGLRKQGFEAAREGFVDAVELAKKQDEPALHFIAAEFAADFARKSKKLRFQVWALREMVAADPARIDVWLQLVDAVDASSKLGISVFKELLAVRPDDARAHMALVAYLIAEGQNRNAMEHLREVIDLELGSPLPFEQLVRFQIQRGRIANARASYVRMSDEFPDDPVTKRTKARIALAEGRPDDAVEILRSLSSEPTALDDQRLLALAEYQSGNLERAADAINSAFTGQRGFPPELRRLKARIHHDSEEWAATLRSLAVLRGRGSEISARESLMLARAHYGLEQPERGRAVLAEILGGENPPAAAALEFARREGGDEPRAATAYLSAALEREPNNPEVLEALVALDFRAGRLLVALRRINRVVQGGGAAPSTLMLRAYVLTKTGDLERAEADALRAFEADPTLAGGVDLLYDIYEAQSRIDEARASFEEAESAGVLHSGARLLLGRIYLRDGDADRARKMFEKVIREDPTATAAKNDLAVLLARNDEGLDRAAILAEESRKANATDPDTADTLGYIYLRKGLHEAALHQFQYGLELNGDRVGSLGPMLHYHLGLTLHEMDRNQEALAAFEKALALDADFPEAVDARRQIEEARRSPAPSPSNS